MDVLCIRETFGTECAICEERDRLRENADEEDPDGKLFDALKPKWRTLYNIIDLNSDEEVRLWEYSYHLFEKFLLEEVHLGDQGLQFFWDLEEGKTIEWRGREKRIGVRGRPFIEADRIDLVDRDPYEESILEEAYPLDLLLNIPTFDDQVRALTGMAVDSTDSSEKEKPSEEEKPSTQRSRRSRSTQASSEKQEPKDNICTEGHTFGTDFDQQPGCQSCLTDDYDVCQQEFASITKKDAGQQSESAHKEEETTEETTSTTQRRRRRGAHTEEPEKVEDKSGGTRSRRRRSR